MRTLFIFVEEASMAIVLNHLCANLCLHRKYKIIEHNGKNELDDSFPRKIKAWRGEADFLIIRDKDSHPNCINLKQNLLDRMPDSRKSVTKIRIVMNELESWYLSDLDALVEAGLINSNEIEKLKNKSKFRNIENLNNAKQEFLKIVKLNGQQRMIAKRIAPYLNPDRSTSKSFKIICNELQLKYN